MATTATKPADFLPGGALGAAKGPWASLSACRVDMLSLQASDIVSSLSFLAGNGGLASRAPARRCVRCGDGGGAKPTEGCSKYARRMLAEQLAAQFTRIDHASTRLLLPGVEEDPRVDAVAVGGRPRPRAWPRAARSRTSYPPPGGGYLFKSSNRFRPIADAAWVFPNRPPPRCHRAIPFRWLPCYFTRAVWQPNYSGVTAPR